MPRPLTQAVDRTIDDILEIPKGASRQTASQSIGSSSRALLDPLTNKNRVMEEPSVQAISGYAQGQAEAAGLALMKASQTAIAASRKLLADIAADAKLHADFP